MSVLKNLDGKEMYVDCGCGCDKGVRFKVDTDEFGLHWIMTYTNGKYYVEQSRNMWDAIRLKAQRIWAILRNKEYVYFDIFMNEKEFEEFKDYINSVVPLGGERK